MADDDTANVHERATHAADRAAGRAPDRADGAGQGDGPADARPIERIALISHADKLDKRERRALDHAVDAAFPHVARYVVAKGSRATRAATRALRDEPEVVVVAGGDGTVRAAAEGLVGRGVPMAVVPSGTANLFAGALRLPTEPDEVVELIRSRSVRALDAGECNGMTFNVMAGAGFDAGLIGGADAAKERLGTLAYLRSGVREARLRRAFEVRVKIDGDVVFDGQATDLLVANLGRLPGGLQAFPDASPTDGRLDVAVITAAGLRDWASLTFAAVRRRQRSTGHAHLWQGTDIKVRLSEQHRFQLDGGVKGKADRLRFRVRPASLLMCAPR